MADEPRFSRNTVIEAANLLTNLSHDKFDNLMIRFSVEDFITYGDTANKQSKINELLRFARGAPQYETDDGTNLGNAIVEKAVGLAHPSLDTGFARSLTRDGFTLTDKGKLRRELPAVADLPQAEDEVHQLLEALGFTTARGHLNQAIENHTLSNWAAANGELRKVLENLFNEVAKRLDPKRASTTSFGHPLRQLLADFDPPFLIEELGEWSSGGAEGKNFVNGVFKRLHPKGGHPGLSDEEDCTFRLHLVLLVSRLFLRRAKQFKDKGYC